MQRESLTAKFHLFVVNLSLKTILFNFIISVTSATCSTKWPPLSALAPHALQLMPCPEDYSECEPKHPWFSTVPLSFQISLLKPTASYVLRRITPKEVRSDEWETQVCSPPRPIQRYPYRPFNSSVIRRRKWAGARSRWNHKINLTLKLPFQRNFVEKELVALRNLQKM
jgi:hypothetical protein